MNEQDEIIRKLRQRVNDLEHQLMEADPFLPIGTIRRHSVCLIDEAPVARRPKHLYFMRCDGHIKIGVSQDPQKRIAQIRCGSALTPVGMDYRKAELVHVIPAAGDAERDLHAKFAHLRHTGEWFVEAPELTEYIESLSERKAA